MNILQTIFTRHGARADARAELVSVDDRIVAELGPRPKIDAASNPEHAELVSTLGNRVRIEELHEDIAQAEDALVRHPPAALLMVGLVLAFAIEVLGAVLLMRVLGVHPSERLPFAAALAAALIGITAVTAHRAALPGSGGSAPAAPQASIAARLQRSIWSLVILVAYALFVCAVVAVRIEETVDDSTSAVGAIAHGLLMLATSLGPAWIAEWLIRRRAPVAALGKRVRVLKGRLKGAERARRKAQAHVNRIAREGALWDGEASRRRALYDATHRLERARQERIATERAASEHAAEEPELRDSREVQD